VKGRANARHVNQEEDSHMTVSNPSRRTAMVVVGIIALLCALYAAFAGSTLGSTAHAAAKPKVKIAYLSFAVANSYDAPMLAAAKAVAKKDGASLTVFDAKNTPATQLSQLQTLTGSKQYNGIMVQPIFGTGLITAVKAAIKAKIKVVNFDQVMGANYGSDKPQVPGLSGNVIFVPKTIGSKLGTLTVQACKAKHENPCKVGYLFDIKASALDVAIRQGFDAATKGSPVKVVAEGESMFTPSVALSAVQTMLQKAPDMNLLVASDQGLEGAASVVSSSKVTLIGYGASQTGLKDIKAGKWYGDVAQLPASEGRIAAQCLITAVQTGKSCGGQDPVAKLPNAGVVTKANVSKFKGEWLG
jgi:ribose transport system substrate-binding protein